MNSLRIEPSQRWVRGWLEGQVVVESREPVLVWVEGFPVPHYAFGPGAFAPGVLHESAPPQQVHPFFGPRGEVSQWYTVSVPGRAVPHAAWRLVELPDHVVVSWEPGVLDRWTEEEEVVYAHPRDPHKRVDALSSSRQVRVELDGQLLADSSDPVVVFETGLPKRYYLPHGDVRLDLLTPSDTVTQCPYKGTTSGYWSFGEHADVAWIYADPVPAVAAIAGRIAFYDEFVDIEVDGVRQVRPHTSFSRD